MEPNPSRRFPTGLLATGALLAVFALSLTAIIATEDEPGYLQEQWQALALVPGDSAAEARELGAWLAWRCRLRSEAPHGYRSYLRNRRIYQLLQDFQLEESRARRTTLISEGSEVTIRSLLADPNVAREIEPQNEIDPSEN